MVDRHRTAGKHQHLWLYYLPLLYLPNLGLERPTPFGTLTLADFLIGPYLVLVYLGSQSERQDGKLHVDTLWPILAAFVWWATLSTILIPFRFDYQNNYHLIFGLLKLGKLSLYGLAAILTIKALSRLDTHQQQGYYWSVLVSGVLVGATLLLSQNSLADLLPAVFTGSTATVYQENPASAMMAVLIVFIVGSLLVGAGSPRWRRFALLGLVVMALGFTMAEGRGGWIAAIVGLLYLFSHVRLRTTLISAIVAIALIVFAYNQYPSFKEQVDRTIQPDVVYLETYDIGVFGLDDGGRLSILLAETPKIMERPLLGRGFFHRGGRSGLFSTGSHNFFLQMFLETGIPGGILMLAIFWRMWRHAGGVISTQKQLRLPLRAALVAAVVVGLSGEYFYGGMVFFTLMLAYAPVGSLRQAVPDPIRPLKTAQAAHHSELG